jgi:hypothetical protein
MGIELHCPKCTKLIRAPDDAGGKRGKCPYCQATVYVPTPVSDDDVIGLAPIDAEEKRREAELRREALQYAASLDRATDETPDRGKAEPAQPPAASPPVPAGEVVDIGVEVSAFIGAMRDSKLDEADQVVEKLKNAGLRARDYVQGLLVDEMPLEIENVPPPLMKGFLKTLLSRLD